MTRKRGLGRGLESLLSDINKSSAMNVDTSVNVTNGQLQQIALSNIRVGKYQPRRNFTEESLQELAQSIKSQGVIQPIVLRSLSKDQYEIVAGERRFRAAKLAGLTTIPAIIKELPDEAAIAVALIENIQRENLNPIEEALSLQRLLDEFEMTHEQIANVIGRSRTAVSNILRLLSLHSEVRELLEMNYLQMGHARALLSLSKEQQLATAKTIVSKELSVRETEDLIRRIQNLQKGTNTEKTVDAKLHEVQQSLMDKLKTKVVVQESASGRGKIILKYKNASDLDRLLQSLLD